MTGPPMADAPHVLVVGSPDRCSGLLHEGRPDTRVSLLCDEAVLADLPGLDDTDQVLALRAGATWTNEVDLVRAAQARYPVTHVAAFTPDRYQQAADLARVLDVPVLPAVGPPDTASGAPTDGVELGDVAGDLVVAVLAEHGDAVAVATIASVPEVSDPSVPVCYLAGADLLTAEVASTVERNALAAAAATGLQTGIATITQQWDGRRSAIVDARIGLPHRVMTRLIELVTGLDLVRCLARQAIGEPVLSQFRRRAAVLSDATCVWLLREPISTRSERSASLGGVDVAEAHPSGRVTIDLLPDAADESGAIRALVWSRASTPGSALQVARGAVASLGFAPERTRPWLS